MYIGIDLGGTNIAVGLVDENNNVIFQDSLPTGGLTRNPQEIVKDMIELSEKVVTSSGYSMKDVLGIGIGCPGVVDNKTGCIVHTENLSFKNTPVIHEFHKYYDIPVVLENDADAAALGEYAVNGENAKSFIMVTLGTGIGGGIILDGKIYKGANGVAGEIGHTVLVHNGIPCNCGRKGCWEVYGSVSGLVNQTRTTIAKHPESLMKKYADERGIVNGRTAFDAAKNGDKVAKEVVNKYIEYVAGGIVNIINIFQPQKLVIGGGISREGDYLIKPIIEYIRKYDYNKFFEPVKIDHAKLFNDAGIIGAAMAAKNI